MEEDGRLYTLNFTQRQLFCVPFRASAELLGALQAQQREGSGAQTVGSIRWGGEAQTTSVISAGGQTWNATCVGEKSCDVLLVPHELRGPGECCDIGKAVVKLQLQKTLDKNVASKFKARHLEEQMKSRERHAQRLKSTEIPRAKGKKGAVEVRRVVHRLTPPPGGMVGRPASAPGKQAARGGPLATRSATPPPPSMFAPKSGSGAGAAQRAATPPPSGMFAKAAPPPRGMTPPPAALVPKPGASSAAAARAATPPPAAVGRAPTPTPGGGGPGGGRTPTPPPGAGGRAPTPPPGQAQQAQRERPQIRPLEQTPEMLAAARENNLLRVVALVLRDRALTKKGLEKELERLRERAPQFKKPAEHAFASALARVADFKHPGKYVIKPEMLRALELKLQQEREEARGRSPSGGAGPSPQSSPDSQQRRSAASAQPAAKKRAPPRSPKKQKLVSLAEVGFSGAGGGAAAAGAMHGARGGPTSAAPPSAAAAAAMRQRAATPPVQPAQLPVSAVPRKSISMGDVRGAAGGGSKAGGKRGRQVLISESDDSDSDAERAASHKAARPWSGGAGPSRLARDTWPDAAPNGTPPASPLARGANGAAPAPSGSPLGKHSGRGGGGDSRRTGDGGAPRAGSLEGGVDTLEEGVVSETDPDFPEYAEHVGRAPVPAAPVRSHEEFVQYRKRYNAQYELYNKLHRKIQALQAQFEALRQGATGAASQAERQRCLRECKVLWRKRARMSRHWDAAFKTLHDELRSTKQAMQAYVDSVQAKAAAPAQP